MAAPQDGDILKALIGFVYNRKFLTDDRKYWQCSHRLWRTASQVWSTGWNRLQKQREDPSWSKWILPRNRKINQRAICALLADRLQMFSKPFKPGNDGIKMRRQSQECSLPSITRRGCRKTRDWADWLSVFKFIRIDVSGQHQSRTSAPPSRRSFIYILAARTLMTPPRPSCGYFLPTPPTLNALIIGCSFPLIDAFCPSIQVFII